MNNFGEWLGKSNGMQMLAEIWKEPNITKEQARAAITTYCILFDIEVDTLEWDQLIKDLYYHYNSFFESIEEMDEYLCKDLV